MKLIVMRHGEAEANSPDGDAGRALTLTGHQQTRKAGEVLSSNGVAVEGLWVSPYRRARQTAENVLQSLSVDEQRVVDHLTPEAPVGHIVAAILACPLDALMLVSHQPLVGSLLASLSGEDPRVVPMMATASMVLLQAEYPSAGGFDIVWQRHHPDFVLTH